MTTIQDPAEVIDLLVFELAEAKHALPLECVREVARAVLITPVPDAPPVVEGVVDIRGEIVPVYDLRLRFGLPPRPLSPDEWLVAAWTGDRVIAFRAMKADQIIPVGRDAISERARVPGGSRHLAGVAQLEDGLVLIDDLAGFLDDAEREQLDEALARRAAAPGASSDAPPASSGDAR